MTSSKRFRTLKQIQNQKLNNQTHFFTASKRQDAPPSAFNLRMTCVVAIDVDSESPYACGPQPEVAAPPSEHEIKIVTRFWIASVSLAVLAIASLKIQ